MLIFNSADVAFDIIWLFFSKLSRAETDKVLIWKVNVARSGFREESEEPWTVRIPEFSEQREREKMA